MELGTNDAIYTHGGEGQVVVVVVVVAVVVMMWW